MENNKEELIKESIETGITLRELKKTKKDKKDKKLIETKEDKSVETKKEKPKPEIKIEGQPDVKDISLDERLKTIKLEVTPEISETFTKGVLDCLAMIFPDKFKEPETKHINSLKSPMFVVMQRWTPYIDLLKYMPEIILATGFIAVLKDMRISETKKEEIK